VAALILVDQQSPTAGRLNHRSGAADELDQQLKKPCPLRSD
jgi:hypothetical protein